jgi:hypothetical protein
MKHLVLLLFFLSVSLSYAGEGEKKSLARFHALRAYYLNWVKTTMGRKVYENDLREFCRTLIYKDLHTEADYVPVAYDSLNNSSAQSNIRYARWLVISGRADKKSLREVLGKEKVNLDSLWRKKFFAAVSGKVIWFRITRDTSGPVVELIFDRVYFHKK